MSLNTLTIKQARDKLQAGQATSVALTRDCLDRIRAVDNKIRACLLVDEEGSLAAAEEADRRRAAGENGDLLGIPYLAKDNIMTQGLKTTAASKILENYVAPYDATIIKKLREAGAVLLGKTNLDEFAHGASTENSAFGPTRNPYNLEHVPGGSSGGSAAAVAADMCVFALGTDTGGSIRQPASFCGVTGLKPTYGRSSRYGLIAMTSSTDVPGPITRTAADAALVLRVIAGRDRRDATTSPDAAPDYTAAGADVKGLKIGLPREYFGRDTSPETVRVIRRAAEEFEKLGAEIIDVSLPHTDYGVAVYYIITPSEISSNLGRFDGIKYGSRTDAAKDLEELYKKSRGRGFGPEPKRRIMLGTYALSAGYYDAYYRKAQKVRTIIKQEFDKVLADVDCLLTPSTPHPAFRLGEQAKDPLAMYLEDIFAVGASLSGLPAMSVPAGFIGNLPIGLQLIAKRFDENTIFRAAAAYQGATEWHEKKPEA